MLSDTFVKMTKNKIVNLLKKIIKIILKQIFYQKIYI